MQISYLILNVFRRRDFKLYHQLFLWPFIFFFIRTINKIYKYETREQSGTDQTNDNYKHEC